MEEEFTLNDFMVKNKNSNQSGNVAQKKKGKQQKKQQIQAQLLGNQLQSEQNQQIQDVVCESLENFLKRGFLKCNSKKERKEMKKLLLQEVKNAKQIGNLQDRDWDNQELPLLSREQIEKKLFNELNAVTQPPKHTEQQIKIIDIIVKKVKEDIINNNFMDQENGDNSEGQQHQILAEKTNLSTVSEKESLSINEKLQNGNKNNYLQYQLDTTGMDVEQTEYNGHFDEDDFDVERMKVPIVGTSTKLEKDYLRLTSYPKANEVRSLETLIKSFDHIRKKYHQKTEDFHYFQSQFRSIRQDLLIQNINNEFTMQVLEENARISLENYDIQEYGRCLGQLIWMYRELSDLSQTNYKEFVYYRLVQNIFEDKKDNLLACLQEINQDDLLLSDEFNEAMKFQHAITMGNVKGFFNLYNNTKNHGKYIMDLSIKKWKVWGIRILCKTYGPQAINITIFQGIFGFNSVEKTLEELLALNCVLDQNNEKLLVKDTISQLDQLRI